MKKSILSAFALSLILFSCSDDDTTSVVDTGDDCTAVVTDGDINYSPGAAVDISGWTWKDATLTPSVISIAARSADELPTASAEVLNGDLTEDKTLDGSYSLTGAYVVKSGYTLTIEAGTEITATVESGDATSVYIAVEAGATININGTATDPVVMSTVAGTSSGWGGLTIAGNAFTTAYDGEAVTAEVSGITYGSDSADNNDESSGSIQYLVLRGTGAQIDTESQYNGLSLFGVGSGTTLEYIAVINGGDDGIEFFGGAAEASYLYLENNEDDSVDWTEGWSGGVSNVYISHTIEDFSTAIEGDKDNYDPYFTNLTAVSTTGGTALQFKKASGGVITGLNLSGYDTEFDVKDDALFNPCNVTIDGEVVSTTSL